MFDAVAMGARIRQLRLAQQMTQEQLATRLGLSVSFVGHIERGNRQASLETLICLSDALDVSTDYLLRGEEGIHITKAQYQTLKDIKRSFDSTKWLEGIDENGEWEK